MTWNIPPAGIPPELTRIINQNMGLLQQIFKTSREGVLSQFAKYKTVDEMYAVLKATVNNGVIITPSNNQSLSRFYNNVGKAWDYGASTVGPQSYVTQLIRDSVIQNTQRYVTKLDTETKTKLSNEINRTIDHNRVNPPNKRIYPQQLAQNLARELDGNLKRGAMISRTETMRASNWGGWTQAKNDGATHFVVDNRAEACNYCQKTAAGKVFRIDETKYIPPYHPHCACIMHYFFSEDRALEAADEIYKDNSERLKMLEKAGYTVPKDGTGPLAPTVDKKSPKETRY